MSRKIVVKGSGDSVKNIKKDEVPAIARISHQGSENFVVWNYGKDGQRMDLLVNTIGSYNGVVGIDFLAGVCTTRFVVSASGRWRIEVLPLGAARTVKVPGSIKGKGDDVVILVGGQPDTAEIGGAAIGNFAIWSYGQTRDLLVNVTGKYRGRVLLDPQTTVLTITSDGPWSIKTSAR